MISKENLLNLYSNLDKEDDDSYIICLKEIRDHILQYLKIILITARNEDEAYTIFETLNARGKNLTFVDLIKNKIFKEMSAIHPNDRAKMLWRKIRDNLSNRENIGNMENYIRHWWLSKYQYVSKNTLYKSFKKIFSKNSVPAEKFIEELHSDSIVYIKISSPVREDFKQQEEIKVYNALNALKIFKIIQIRPFLLSLFKAREAKKIKHKKFIKVLTFVERFHFLFNAVCSLRPSGIEKSYSSSAISLQECQDEKCCTTIISNLKQTLTKKIPEYEIFRESFSSLKVYDGYTKNKKLIQYILIEIEKYLSGT